MYRKLKQISLIIFCLANSIQIFAKGKIFKLQSPDKKVNVEIEAGDILIYSVQYAGKPVLAKSPISMTLYDGKVLGSKTKVSGSTNRSINQQVKPLYGIANIYKDNFQEVTITFADKFSVIFRAYNEGVAYRFATNMGDKIKIKNEQVVYNFGGDYSGFFSELKDIHEPNSYEVHYRNQKLSQNDTGASYLPLVVDVPTGPKVLITEVDLLDYPALYLRSDGKSGLTSVMPTVVTKTKLNGWNNVNYQKLYTERADFIAETNGNRSFPWRAMIFAHSDKDFLNSNLVYLLATESKIKDVSWIQPGKVSWDWWNSNNLTGVDFKTGFNTETYKYFIDFAAKNGIKYVNIDEGWSDQTNLLKVTDKLDMPEVVRYAKSKNVGLFLWCIWHELDEQMTEALDQFQKWGIAGIKVDFMDRDDQEVVNFYEKCASEAAKRKILVNFHGAMKPTGLERTYPNVINREAVQGLEYNKFGDKCTPEHAATVPFIRMVAGPMDYTPGAMQNHNKADFRIINDRPMSQGTRCQQLAMFVLFYAPLEMMADAPTAYEKEPDILKFCAEAPTVWDETVALDGKISDFAVIARRKGDKWYIGGLTDWTARNVYVDLSFLPAGNYEAEIFSDGANADRVGNDYRRSLKTVTSKDKLPFDMAPGGGFAVVLSKK